MHLPGGLVENGERRRDWAFRPLSGAIELALSEIGAQAQSMPQAVTRALSLALESLGGGTPSEVRVGQLCVSDRQFLMRELERHLGFEGGWFHADCVQCRERFDFQIAYGELPVKEAGPGYPQAQIDIDGCRLTFRLPNGVDQEALLSQPETTARSWLLQRLVVDGEPPTELVQDQAVAAAAEAALESVAPGIVLMVQAACPACGASNKIQLDPYRAVSQTGGHLLEEVHRIASQYHWSEEAILNLPHERRQRYLRLIEQETEPVGGRRRAPHSMPTSAPGLV